MTVKITRDEATAQDLRRLAGQVKDGRVARRLLAIALVLEGASRRVAAESCGMDRQTLRDWIHRYNAQGPCGLSNRGGGGVRPVLCDARLAQVSAWVEAGPDPVRDGVWPSWASGGSRCVPNTPRLIPLPQQLSKKLLQQRS